jgi:hypothetical protein
VGSTPEHEYCPWGWGRTAGQLPARGACAGRGVAARVWAQAGNFEVPNSEIGCFSVKLEVEKRVLSCPGPPDLQTTFP